VAGKIPNCVPLRSGGGKKRKARRNLRNLIIEGNEGGGGRAPEFGTGGKWEGTSGENLESPSRKKKGIVSQVLHAGDEGVENTEADPFLYLWRSMGRA